jgi:hypothetical protein
MPLMLNVAIFMPASADVPFCPPVPAPDCGGSASGAALQ